MALLLQRCAASKLPEKKPEGMLIELLELELELLEGPLPRIRRHGGH